MRRGKKSDLAAITNRRALTTFAMKKNMQNIKEQADTEATVMHALVGAGSSNGAEERMERAIISVLTGATGRLRKTGEAMNSVISTVEASERKRRTKTEILLKSSRDYAVTGARFVLMMIRAYTVGKA